MTRWPDGTYSCDDDADDDGPETLANCIEYLEADEYGTTPLFTDISKGDESDGPAAA